MMRTLSTEGRNTGEIILFIHKLCDHLDACFPEDDSKEWSSDISFEFGLTDCYKEI